MKVWMNGEILEPAQACVSVLDHGLLYGDGVFEGIRFYNKQIFRCRQHLERLEEGTRILRLPIPYTLAQIEAAMLATIDATGLTDGYIRLVVTRGEGQLGLSIQRTGQPRVFAIVDTIRLYPQTLYETGMPIISSTIAVKHPTCSPRIKSLNYLNNILAKIEAEDAGVQEAVMYNHAGEVAECTADNIFIVKNGHVATPPPSAGLLSGVTRGVVMELCRELGLPIAEKTLVRHDLYTADEIFLTGTGAEVIAVNSLDRRPIGPVGTREPVGIGPVTRSIMQAFRQCVARECT